MHTIDFRKGCFVGQEAITKTLSSTRRYQPSHPLVTPLALTYPSHPITASYSFLPTHIHPFIYYNTPPPARPLLP